MAFPSVKARMVSAGKLRLRYFDTSMLRPISFFFEHRVQRFLDGLRRNAGAGSRLIVAVGREVRTQHSFGDFVKSEHNLIACSRLARS